ncbi:MAG: DUF4007 family protein [Tildeniella nuda ZEHNDER 1965/U140]|jgi:hypothetical protein|nr:DUF4007 family protein [Tildeniella nuda ZEHNDER 1965/U140]
MTVSTPQAPATRQAFARHETFHPRFGWLKKGVDQATQDPAIFLQDDATVRLGVGKNMVRSIRYWCSAFKLLEDVGEASRHENCPTEFGKQLLGSSGWDPYLEDPASLWLLHWKLLEDPCSATTWAFVFNQFRGVEFTVDELFNQLCDYRDREAARVADSSLRKDMNCLLRMYGSQQFKASASEESLDCPFADLGLIRSAGNARSYTFRIGAKPTLPAEIVVYACLRYVGQFAEGVQNVPVVKLLYDRGSPGLVFRLTESALYEAIEYCSRFTNDRGGAIATLGIADVAGKLEFFFLGQPLQMAEDILNRYYATR